MRKEPDKRKKVEPRRRTTPRRAPTKASKPPRAAENLPRATLDGLAAHVAVVNEKGVIEAVNKAWRDFGADNGPVRGRIAEGADYLAVCDAASGEDRELALAFAGAIREVLAGRRERFEAEYPCHSPDKQRWFIGRVSRLPGDGPPRAVVAHEDITSRKVAEMALERSQAELRAIYENAPVMMCVLDTQRQVLFANRALREFTSTTQTDLVAERACSILGCVNAPVVADASNISPECAGCELRQAVEDTLRTGNGRHDVEYHAALERNGVRRSATLLGSTAMIQSGNQSSLLLCIHDVSEREQAKQERLRIIAELNAAQRLANIGSWRWDLVADTAHWSDEMYRIFEPASPLSAPHRTNFMQLVHPDDRQRVAQARTVAVTENKPYDIDFRILLPDGRVKVVHSQGEVLRRDDGTPILMHGTTQDITQRKAAEEERVRIIAELNEAQRIARVGSWQWDLINDKAQWSEETYRIFGLGPAPLLHHRHSFLDMLHPDDRVRADLALSDAVNGRKPYDLDYRIRLPDGRQRVIHAHAEVLRRPDGTATALRGTVQDITERKQLEDDLRHMAASLAEAQTMSRIGSWHSVFKAGEEILSESDEQRRIWGFGAGERTTVQAVLERIHPDDRASTLENWAAARRDGNLREWEHRILVDGKVKWIHARIELDCDEAGRPVEIRGTNQDITERKLAQEEASVQQAAIAQLSRVVAMGELTAGIAHEINQPLGASLLYAETCRDLLKAAPPDVAQLLLAMNTLVGQLERAKATVTRMRKFIHRKPLSFSTVDANNLLADAAKLLAYELKEANVRLVLKLHPLTPPSRADPVLIQQVAINLMINAIEAMRTSNSPRRLTLGTSAAADGACIVSVADTGPGVPESLADRVFDSFVTSKPEGLGLGLAISRTIVEQHGGRIWYEPGEKGGAVFKFSLPSMPSGAKEDLQ